MSRKHDIFDDRYSYANHKKVNRKNTDDSIEDLTGKGKKKWSKRKKKIVLIASIAVAVVVTLIAGLMIYMFGGMSFTRIDKDKLGINSEFPYLNSGVKNIALFGIDASSGNTSRSDTIMIISVNPSKGTIKVSSILRDSRVEIELPNGNTIHEKITHAYHYGGVYANEGYDTSGPELAIKTINQNFNLDVQDFVAVDFSQAAEVVDYLGGIDIVITEAERRNMNNMDYGKLYDNDNAVYQTGLVHLNGMQACQYARIREIDSDNERTNRQGKVLELLLEKVKSMKATQYPGFIKAMLNIVETSMSYSTILSFVPMISSDLALQRVTFPQTTDPDGPYYMEPGSEVIGGVYEGMWVWRYDTEVVSTHMHNFIYETDIAVSKQDYSGAGTYDATDYDDDNDKPDDEPSSSAVSSEDVSSEVSSAAVSSTAPVSSAVVSSKPTSSVATSSQVSSQEVSSEAVSSEDVSSEAVSSEAVSSEAVSSEAVSSTVSEEPVESEEPVDSSAETSSTESVEEVG